jgi:hypothetical protein
MVMHSDATSVVQFSVKREDGCYVLGSAGFTRNLHAAAKFDNYKDAVSACRHMLSRHDEKCEVVRVITHRIEVSPKHEGVALKGRDIERYVKGVISFLQARPWHAPLVNSIFAASTFKALRKGRDTPS